MRILGYTVEEIQSMGDNVLPGLMHPDDFRIYLKEILPQYQTTGDEEIIENEYRMKHKDGTWVWLESKESIFMRQDDGIPKQIFGLAADISDRKKSERDLARYRENLEELVRERTILLEEKTEELEQINLRLQELDRLKSMFIASMSHELRTPLNSIIGFTGIILQGLAGEINDEQKTQLTMIKRSAGHLLDLITDIIDLSKIEAGKLEPFIEKFDLSALVREVTESFAADATSKGIRLSLDIPDKLSTESDRRRISQVIMNLLSNALKFTDSGEIKVELKLEGKDCAKIAITDTGIGIRKEKQSELFIAFSQIREPDFPIAEGTGLGLYLSKKIITLLGGTIELESTFGQGSRFVVFLPIRRE